MTDKLEKAHKKVASPKLRYYYVTRKTEEKPKNSNDSRFSARDLNPEPPSQLISLHRRSIIKTSVKWRGMFVGDRSPLTKQKLN